MVDLYVGSGVTMNGKFHVPGAAEIDGAVTGVINANSINITINGVLKGSSVADDVRVEGQLNETVIVQQTLVIEATGKVEGNITYTNLEVKKGGSIQGDITVTQG
ncbi:MAG: polymer-forming cytoskeletal protein [Oxalobacteraceae bacterium]|jgi:cytoskeletal protein CcmA (bactofilin family)|nr:polymer-forming cytoskeletal protein [Oxalobacteraceae bacterium]